MTAPLLVLDFDSPLPPYEQINFQIRMQIVSGNLLPETRLPSVRQLARDLDVAPNTVVRAYNELEHDGWVMSISRQGFVVAHRPPTLSSEERTHQLGYAIDQLLVTAHQLGVDLDDLYAAIDQRIRSAKEHLARFSPLRTSIYHAIRSFSLHLQWSSKKTLRISYTSVQPLTRLHP